MKAFRKKILITFITGIGVLGLFNVSVHFGKIMDFFPGISLSLLLAEELLETEGESAEKSFESGSWFEGVLTRESHILHTLSASSAVDVFLHSVEIPLHPHFEKVTPPPKA